MIVFFKRVKVDMKKICLSSFENFKFQDELNITPDNFKAFKDWSLYKDTIIQKADKGNFVVILNERNYIKRMTEMLSDINKFKKLCVKPTTELNLLLKGKLLSAQVLLMGKIFCSFVTAPNFQSVYFEWFFWLC